MGTAIVCGALANKPMNGGNAWTRLHWVFGLRKLGFDVHLVEQITRDACVDADGKPTPFDRSANLAYFRLVAEQFDLASSMSLIYERGEETYGLSYAELLDLGEATDLLVNIGGHLRLEALRRLPRCKVYFDDDPGYTQFWHARGSDAAHLDGHDFYYTVGANIGTPGCVIPTFGINWRPMPPPVALDCWPLASQGSPDRFTTVASWRGAYGPVELEDVTLGLKVHEFRKFIRMPQVAPGCYEIALDIHPAEGRDLDLLGRHGWRLADPKAVVPDPLSYRTYIQDSAAEFSVAQGIYVQTGSGWFSDRTACYLASGKPTLVQDTGFGRLYPVGEGLLSFYTLDEAVQGAERIIGDYETHSRAARALAEAYFDSDVVLGRLLGEVGVTP